MQEALLNLKNMYTRSCIRLVELELQKLAQTEVLYVKMGSAGIRFDPAITSLSEIERCLFQLGFPLINDPDVHLCEKVKLAAIELIFQANNVSSLIRNSDYISDKLQTPYERISRIFSKVTGHTLEKYLIMLKIERAKELMRNNEYTLSEIAYMMGYSSVQYLSNQFKKVTGLTVSEFRENGGVDRIALEDLPEKHPYRNFTQSEG
jgi:AraC family transcriptional regulator